MKISRHSDAGWGFFFRLRDPYIMMTSSMEIFFALLAICAGNSPVIGEFPAQRTVTRSFDVFFDLRSNKWLSKQSCGWWFETPSRPLWRHCYDGYHCVYRCADITSSQCLADYIKIDRSKKTSKLRVSSLLCWRTCASFGLNVLTRNASSKLTLLV